MSTKVVKTETIAEFLARGGKITLLSERQKASGKKTYTKSVPPLQEEENEEVNYGVIPESLKITLGIKG